MTVKAFYRTLLTADVIVITIASLMPPGNSHLGGGWDKVGHFLIYATLAFIICLNFSNPKQRLIALLAGIAYGAFMEICQSQIPGREASILDEAANTMGIIIGAVLFLSLGKRLEMWIRRRHE